MLPARLLDFSLQKISQQKIKLFHYGRLHLPGLSSIIFIMIMIDLIITIVLIAVYMSSASYHAQNPQVQVTKIFGQVQP